MKQSKYLINQFKKRNTLERENYKEQMYSLGRGRDKVTSAIRRNLKSNIQQNKLIKKSMKR